MHLKDEMLTEFTLFHHFPESTMTTTVEEVIYPESWCLGASAFAVFFCIFGFCGNFLTIAALLRCERLRKHATTGKKQLLLFGNMSLWSTIILVQKI
jgi:hypothetical protein